MRKLDENEIQHQLEKVGGWKYKNNAIETTYEFDDFKEAFSKMTRIAFECETQNHHPEWTNIYNKVNIRLTTHDADGVTRKDFNLALAIERIIIEK